MVAAIAWLVAVAVIGLGGAGVAASLNRPPASGARPELTWTGDRQAAPALDAATARLQALSDAVDALGTSSKRALADFVAGDTASLASDLASGTAQLEAVTSSSAGLRAALAAVPDMDALAPLRVSAATIARYRQLLATPGLAANLETDWQQLSARAQAASVVPGLLAQHDRQTAAAAAQGEAGHYQAALALLDAPDATLALARQAAASLARTADVSTLTQWMDRQAAYDAALRRLYTVMLSSRGKVTSAVRAAFAAEEAAKAALPTSTKGIVVIMGAIAQGGLDRAVVDIEVARGSLAAALAAQLAGTPASPTGPAATSPVPTPPAVPTAPPPSSAAAPSPASPGTPAPAPSHRPGATTPP